MSFGDLLEQVPQNQWNRKTRINIYKTENETTWTQFQQYKNESLDIFNNMIPEIILITSFQFHSEPKGY